jgi:hypothetical protein
MQNLATRVTKAESHHRWVPLVGAVVGVERCNLGMHANLGEEGDEVREPSSLGPRVGAAVGVERCFLGMHANLGDDGDEGKEPSSLEPRVGAVVGVERCSLGIQILATMVTKTKSHHHWSRVWERWWVSRDAAWEYKSWQRG